MVCAWSGNLGTQSECDVPDEMALVTEEEDSALHEPCDADAGNACVSLDDTRVGMRPPEVC